MKDLEREVANITDVIAKGIHSPALLARLQSAEGELERLRAAAKVIDVQALAGDSTDNVPGAPGIGVKTAAQLIGEYGSLDALLERAGEIKQPKRRETLTNPENVERIRI